MQPDRLEHSYSVLFDERQESWYVAHDTARRIPLSRGSLERLVSLYNNIHRGAPLTLLDRRTIEELCARCPDPRATTRSYGDRVGLVASARTRKNGARGFSAHLQALFAAIRRSLRRIRQRRR
jgi:hypothetical protein